MTISSEQVDAIIERTAQILAEKIEASVSSMADLTVFDLRLAAQLVGLSTKQAALYLPITRTAEGKHGVTIGAIRTHIETRTQQPKGLARRKTATV